MKSRLLTITVGAIVLSLAPHAQGAISYSLAIDGCSGGCGPAPFGNVVLTALDSQTVDVKVTLLSPHEFVNTGSGNALEFDIAGSATINPSRVSLMQLSVLFPLVAALGVPVLIPDRLNSPCFVPAASLSQAS
jgi:hypothetical protein